MLTPIANRHRYPLPKPGAIVVVNMHRGRLPFGYRLRKFIVESYPLADGAFLPGARRPMSLGIHTVTLRALDNGERRRVSGHWCEALD